MRDEDNCMHDRGRKIPAVLYGETRKVWFIVPLYSEFPCMLKVYFRAAVNLHSLEVKPTVASLSYLDN